MKNHYDQPIGNLVHGWVTREMPIKKILEGRYCYLERITPEKHFEDLYEVYGPKSATENWTYLPLDKFEDPADFSAYLETVSRSKDPLHYAIIDKMTQKALGTLALMRISPEQGTIEVGFVIYSDRLKKTRIATEAQYLAASYAIGELGYRRYEWKCDSLNEPSKKSALRLGFVFEGVFRQALIYKGRNRDTAWFSIIDSEWPEVKRRLESWLDPENFTQDGKQKKSLWTC
ncbi:GNAT family N-acetyltransferase [Enterococcus sp. DIV0242_7C1]|uniref:N-acetyltransferase domain-containing protein n=1 Tax=Candidatus Enterococcus dunnyi TaxID=1834192 RepID=A0A200IYZ8_9ENTE|nr:MULTISPECIES: GNAT family protein [unclassified Enterococcus]MBO0470430.1 GNAT family N-acetyltransferase [Enterococcus sp. DIV0242_7C1]OUZ30206.1 hypothetical protein A5889_002494 [Enterococcus sp. 9D6_DIV0238]